jgi:glycosyltransferase involved in cell wall biosynthesis
MQLLMVNANNFVNKNELAKNLRLYKFREDVKLLENLSQIELVRAMAAAYVIIYLSLVKDLHIPLIEAMKCDVPLITNSVYAIPEICGDAALYVNYDDDKDIANKIMMIFKDEVLRAELILKGKNQAKKYSWENTSSLLWQSITKSTE